MWDGASEGYVKYNITPALGTRLSVGDTFTISGQAYWRDGATAQIYVVAGITLDINGNISPFTEIGRISKSISKGKTGTFSMTCTVTQALANFSSTRDFLAYMSFTLEDSSGGGSGTYTTSAQRLSCLKSRLAPTVSDVTFTDSTGGLSRFGAMVQNASNISIGMTTALDPLDTSLTVASRVLTIGGTTFNLSSDTELLGLLNMTGSKTWSLTVTDSAGLSATVTSGSSPLNFLAYTAPTLSRNTIEPVLRYEKVQGEQGEVVRQDADDGIYAWYSFIANVAAVNSLNAWSVTAKYREVNTENWSAAITLSSGTDGNTITASRTWSAATEALTFDAGVSYEFILSLSDFFNEVSLGGEISKAGGYFYIGKNGVAVGMRGTGTVAAPKFESAYPAHFYDDIRQNGKSLFWNAGDEITIGSNVFAFAGFITSSTTVLFITIPVGKPIRATGATVSGCICVRTIKGYINSGNTDGFNVNGSGYTSSVTIANAEMGLLHLRIAKSSAYTNATNNTPIVAMGGGTTPLTITFT